MAQKKNDLLMRRQLDKRLGELRKLRIATPPQGWLKSLRESMGLSLSQLAKRLKMTPQGLADIEAAEQRGSITLATLRKVAAALEADVKLAVVPHHPLANTVNARARRIATRIAKKLQVSKRFEGRYNAEQYLEDWINDHTAELVRSGDRRIWDET